MIFPVQNDSITVESAIFIDNCYFPQMNEQEWLLTLLHS